MWWIADCWEHLLEQQNTVPFSSKNKNVSIKIDYICINGTATKKHTRKNKWQTNKIFSDQQDIAIKHSEINIKSKEEFLRDWEKNTGPMPDNSRFPSVLQIYDKFSGYDKLKQEIEQTTPKKVSSKIEEIEVNFDNNLKQVEEDKVSFELELSDIKLGKLTKQELQYQAQIDIENKITEANNLQTVK